MKKIKATAVNYLNTKPLLYGILKSGLNELIELQTDIPSECARKLKAGEVDFALVPVAVIPELTTPAIISDYCIGTVGAVKTVVIFSEKPLHEVDEIYLDYQSRTSVELTKILLKNYWKIAPKLIAGSPGFETEIGGNKAGLVIGDRVIRMGSKFPFVYDLGEIWLQYSGLPFVFAAWVSNGWRDAAFEIKLNEAFALGIREIPNMLHLMPDMAVDFDLKTYFTKNISYEFDRDKKTALSKFLQQITTEKQPGSEHVPPINIPA